MCPSGLGGFLAWVPHSSRPPNQDRPSLKTASLSQWTKRPEEVPGGKVLPAGDGRESFEQQRPITALTRPYSDSTLITDPCPQRANGVGSTTHPGK